MNILISTTTNHNCGDDFIRFGCKNILKHIFPQQPNYIHYDRNPNNMIDYPHDQRMKKGLRGNFMNNPIDWDLIDLVVLAGTPEWLHHPLEPIYEGLVDHPEIPLWAIGVGYTEPNFVLPLTDAEVKVLKRENTLIITRQQELALRVSVELGGKTIYSLPCPALFCFEDFPEKKKENTFICHSLDEISEDCFFSSDANDILEKIGAMEVCVSDRLHGAIAAISGGAKTTLTNTSFRCQEAIKQFSEVIEADGATITAFKVKHLSNYINIIKPYYDGFRKMEKK